MTTAASPHTFIHKAGLMREVGTADYYNTREGWDVESNKAILCLLILGYPLSSL